MAYRVFLSHSGKDADWVRYIAQQARSVGVEPYLYEHDPQPGQLLAEKIKREIVRSDSLAVLLTQDGRSSPYVEQEIGFAEAKGKLVVPLVEPGVDKDGLAMLQGREYISFDLENPGSGLASLLDYLTRLKAEKEQGQGILLLAGLLVGAAWLGRH